MKKMKKNEDVPIDTPSSIVFDEIYSAENLQTKFLSP